MFLKACPPGEGAWGGSSMNHFLHKPDNWSSVPRIQLKAMAVEQVSVSTGHLCLGMGDRDRGS